MSRRALLPAGAALLLLCLWPLRLSSTRVEVPRSPDPPEPGLETPAAPCLLLTRSTRPAEPSSFGDVEIEGAVRSARAEAGALDDADARSPALEALLDDLGSEDAYRLLTVWAVAPPPDAQDFAALLLRRLAGTDADALEHWARDLPESSLRSAAFTALAIQRSEVDGLAALVWVRNLNSASSPSEMAAAIQVATELARVEPVEAVDVASRLPPSPVRDQCLAHCVAQWAAIEPVEALSWAAAIEDDGLRQGLLSCVITAMASEDPRAAADWTAVALPDGALQAEVAVAVAQRWAQRDPESAWSWIETFPDDRLRHHALVAVELAAPGPREHEIPSPE